MSLADLQVLTSQITLSTAGVGILLAVIRLVLGPTLPDRVVALDLITILAVGITAAYSVTTGEAAFLDAAIVLALIAFLGTVAFAYYIEKRGSQ